MIERIIIKNVASYDAKGIQISDLKKVNFIYGTNGCGKTTLSNFLHDTSDSKFVSCSCDWKNGQEINTLTYNKNFRERNFGKGKLNGIFTLGEATTEQIKVIEEKIGLLKVLKEEGTKKRQTLKEQTLNLEQLET